jgi:hypothetical protein
MPPHPPNINAAANTNAVFFIGYPSAVLLCKSGIIIENTAPDKANCTAEPERGADTVDFEKAACT